MATEIFQDIVLDNKEELLQRLAFSTWDISAEEINGRLRKLNIDIRQDTELARRLNDENENESQERKPLPNFKLMRFSELLEHLIQRPREQLSADICDVAKELDFQSKEKALTQLKELWKFFICHMEEVHLEGIVTSCQGIGGGCGLCWFCKMFNTIFCLVKMARLRRVMNDVDSLVEDLEIFIDSIECGYRLKLLLPFLAYATHHEMPDITELIELMLEGHLLQDYKARVKLLEVCAKNIPLESMDWGILVKLAKTLPKEEQSELLELLVEPVPPQILLVERYQCCSATNPILLDLCERLCSVEVKVRS